MYELDIDFDEVSRYLGFKNDNVDEITKNDIEIATNNLKTQVDFKIEHKVFNITKEENTVKIDGTTLILTGKAISQLLQDCNQCILLAVTLGQKVDMHLRKLQITNLNQAVITDFCASSMIENLCNQVDDDLKQQWSNLGMFFTDRFSPGYGDLPLAIQTDFCKVLDTTKKMGLNVSSSGLMIPRKSITAIIGIANEPQKMKIKGCKYCDFLKNCEYRKGGKTCG